MARLQWVLQKLTDVRAQFRADNPPPYLDLSTDGQIYRVLTEAIDEIQLLTTEEASNER